MENDATSRITEAAKRHGWSFEPSYVYDETQSPITNTKALKNGSTTYPTLINPDGNVRFALTNQSIYLHNGNVWLGDPYHVDSDKLTIFALVVDANCRKQGLATPALLFLQSLADELKIKMLAEPAQMTAFKKPKALTTLQLRKWYKRHGWERMYPDTDRILVYRPKNH
jgi:hypothetical protein